jgi:glyoxylase-like metal-dependent hydrolase (beta-lactamase superfamily II)
MIFRQLFDGVSGTCSYLLAGRHGGEAMIIDPVIEKVDRCLQLVAELDLKLVKAVDTHLHADHVTGLGALRGLVSGVRGRPAAAVTPPGGGGELGRFCAARSLQRRHHDHRHRPL